MNKDKAIEWIATHRVGTSSKTMWAALMGVNADPQHPYLDYDVPYDSDDFSRCRDLVEFCEVNSAEDFPKILRRFPWYGPIMRNWNKLTELYEDSDHKGVHELLFELRKEVNEIRKRCKYESKN